MNGSYVADFPDRSTQIAARALSSEAGGVTGELLMPAFNGTTIIPLHSKTQLLMNQIIFAVATLWLLAACGGSNSESNVEPPGDDKSAKTRVLDAGAELLQDKAPLKQFSAYLDGFHFYNGNIDAQIEAHHYVSQLNEDVHQAIIFDGNGKDAKIMGVEYIVSERLFKTLDDEEKKLWHSHHHEVKSGTLIAPGIPDVAEHELMEKLVSTYGKTIHTWHTDQRLTLPIGSPMIMMGFTRDGQIHPELIEERDKRFNVSTADIRKKREDIPMPRVDPMANAWEKDKANIRQFIITNRADSAMHKHQGKVQRERD